MVSHRSSCWGPLCPARVHLVFALLALLVPPDLFAQLKDAAGSKDHPMIKRYEGSTIIGYDFRKFNDFEILLGPVQRDESRHRGMFKPTKSQRLEGQTTRILYTAPEGRSPLEVVRNYEQELKQAGFQTLYKCARAECGTEVDGQLGEYYLYPLANRLKNTPAPGTGRPAKCPSTLSPGPRISTSSPRNVRGPKETCMRPFSRRPATSICTRKPSGMRSSCSM